MILMEHSQTVRTTHRPVEPQDWWRVQRVYRFCQARAIERLVLAEPDPANPNRERRDLRVLESMYGKARQHHDVLTGCAVTYFRARSLKDAHHPDFLGEWI